MLSEGDWKAFPVKRSTAYGAKQEPCLGLGSGSLSLQSQVFKIRRPWVWGGIPSNSFPTSVGYQDTLGRTSGGPGEQAANLLMRFLLFSAPGA